MLKQDEEDSDWKGWVQHDKVIWGSFPGESGWKSANTLCCRHLAADQYRCGCAVFRQCDIWVHAFAQDAV